MTHAQEAQAWLDDWDADQSVTSISSAQEGDSEQAIQTLAVEYVRWFLSDETTVSEMQNDWPSVEGRMNVPNGSLTQSELAAALALGCFLYGYGPETAAQDESVADRLITVSKT